MQKLRLNPDDLQVESFRSSDTPESRGTVAGYSQTHTEPTCGACQTTMNDVECWQYSVYEPCQEEVGP